MTVNDNMWLNEYQPKWVESVSEYRAERACFRMCIDRVRYYQSTGDMSRRKRWIGYLIEHRDNLRRIRRSGRIAPF